MTAPTGSRTMFVLEDCESLLAKNLQVPVDADQIVVDVELFEALVDLARRARAWGA